MYVGNYGYDLGWYVSGLSLGRDWVSECKIQLHSICIAGGTIPDEMDRLPQHKMC